MSKIEIVPYNKEWPLYFEKVLAKLTKGLKGLYVSVDHIGSTSVPGLASKNKIDVQITVSEINDEFKKRIDAGLVSVGFAESYWNEDHRPPGDTQPDEYWKKLYVKGAHPDLNFSSNIHIRILGRANQIYPLLFRDYLKAHRDSAMAYQKVKEELVRFNLDSDAYSEIKDPVCDLIMVDAYRWAKETNWRP